MSNMLSNIVAAVIDQIPDSVVAGRSDTRDHLFSDVRLMNADVVVVQDENPDKIDSFLALLRRFPALLVVAITADGTAGYLHELRPHTTYLAELSAAALQVALGGDHQRTIN